MMAGAIQHRLHTRDMHKMGGLWHNAPRMGACALFFAVASLGLPGLGNFVAEFLVLFGLFAVQPWIAVVAAMGLIGAAIYSLWMIQLTFHGESKENREFADFGGREITTMAAMMVALILLGLYPQPIFDMAEPVLNNLQSIVLTQGEVL
jgi:NADH-quinone oxidoreductase subunit M